MLEIKNVFASYGNAQVLKDVSFSVKKGNRLSIIGANGCGKTTLLRIISGLMEYKGEVVYNGNSIKAIKNRKHIARKIALLTQTTNVYFPYTVFETVAFGLYSRNKSTFGTLSSIERDFVLKTICDVGLIDEKDKLVSQLSGGQFRRVFLARAFAQNPDVLLLDEPTNYLDIKCQYDFLEQINYWAANNDKIIICVMHDLNLAAEFSKDVLMLNAGVATYFGKINELMHKDELSQAFNIDVKSIMINLLKKWEA